LLIHGIRIPGIASFDLPVPGGSLAEDLANSGYVVYLIDIRGYGRSTRPKQMSEPPENNPPLVRSPEVARDIDATIDFIRQQTGWKLVSLFGWATGAQWAGYYATLHSDKLSNLVIHNSLYGANTAQPLVGHGSDLEDPAHPGQFKPTIGAYRWNSGPSVLGGWDKNIPTEGLVIGAWPKARSLRQNGRDRLRPVRGRAGASPYQEFAFGRPIR
jgi:pimeloyl-ACP methyl ester carboxylesterase